MTAAVALIPALATGAAGHTGTGSGSTPTVPAPTTGTTTAWRAGSWHVDVADVVRANDVVLDAAPKLGKQSMPLGNGSAGAAVWGQNGFTAQLNRVDTMPDRKSAGWLQIPGLAAMTDAADYTGTLDLYDATFRQSGGGMTATTYVRADKDEIVVQVTGADPATVQSATVDLQSGRTPTASASGAVGALAETWVDTDSPTGGTGKTYGSLAGLTAGGRDVTASAPTSNSVKVSFTPRADGSFTVVVAMPKYTGGDGLKAAEKALGSDGRASASRLAAHHLSWWHGYWKSANLIQASSEDGDAEFMANLRTINLYTLAASERSSQPSTQAGVNPLFSFSRDSQQWGGGWYWFWNLRMQLAANLGNGTTQLNTSFFDMYRNDLATIEKWTRTSYPGTEGICVPETMRFDGTGWYIGTSTWNPSCDPTDPSYNADTISTGAELASWVWRQYQMTDDVAFLRQNYPLISESAKFLLSVATLGTDGKLHTVANAHETQWQVQDPITDISAMQMLFPIVVQAASVLHTDKALAARAETAIGQIPDLPRTDATTHRTLKTAADDGDGDTVLGFSSDPSAAYHNNENLDLEPVWPYGLISDQSSLFDLAKTTYADRQFKNSNSWTYDAVQAARLGLSDQVASALHDQAATYVKFASGLASWSSSLTEPYDETNGVVDLTLNEILATDYDGLLRIAPAVPDDWSMSGTVSIQHRSTVHVQVSDGTVTTAVVESGSNHEVTFRNPWSGQRVEVVDGRTGRTVVRATSADKVSFTARKGGSYVIEQASQPLSRQSYAALDAAPASAPRTLAGSTAVIGITVGTTGHCAAPTSTLVASWDATSGDTVADASSSGRDLTFTGQSASYATDGPTGSAAVLNGGYLAGSSTTLGYLEAATFAVEVKPTAADGYRRILDWKSPGGGDGDGVILDLTPSNQLRLITAGQNTVFSTTLPADTWSNVVVVVAEDGTVDVYVGGTRVAGTTLSSPGVDGCLSGTPRIGGDQSGGQTLTGEVDRAAVFARALSADEVADWQDLTK